MCLAFQIVASLVVAAALGHKHESTPARSVAGGPGCSGGCNGPSSSARLQLVWLEVARASPVKLTGHDQHRRRRALVSVAVSRSARSALTSSRRGHGAGGALSDAPVDVRSVIRQPF